MTYDNFVTYDNFGEKKIIWCIDNMNLKKFPIFAW